VFAFCIASHAFNQRRRQFSLRYHAPFVKLLLLAVEELMALLQLAYQGVGCRAAAAPHVSSSLLPQNQKRLRGG